MPARDFRLTPGTARAGLLSCRHMTFARVAVPPGGNTAVRQLIGTRRLKGAADCEDAAELLVARTRHEVRSLAFPCKIGPLAAWLRMHPLRNSAFGRYRTDGTPSQLVQRDP